MSEDHDIRIEITPPSKDSMDNPDRRELFWESREEKLLHGWKDDMIVKSKKHYLRSKKFKKLYLVFGCITIFIPLILSGIIDMDIHPYVISFLMIFSGMVSGLSTFINFGKKFQAHSEFDNKYSGLALEIESELRKPKKNRIACDVFLERMRLTYGNLDMQAPMI